MKASSEKEYHRKEIVREQIETAVFLFLNGKDLSSVITLSGAATNILEQLIRNVGKEPFVDYACKVHKRYALTTPPRKKYNHHINVTLGVIAHKHMSPKCSERIFLDLERCAFDALIRAICDYALLYGQEESFVKDFLIWSYRNKNGAKLMEAYKGLPEKIKRYSKNE